MKKIPVFFATSRYWVWSVVAVLLLVVCVLFYWFARDPVSAAPQQSKVTTAHNPAHLPSSGIWQKPDTNMIWMRCSLGQTWTGTTCTGDAIRYSWDAAQEAVATLNRNGGYGGYSDWVLPHIQDLSSLMVCSAGTQSRDVIPAKGGFDIVIDADCAKTSVSPTIDPIVFPNTAAFFYLSASSVLHWHDNVWVVSFNNGTISDYLYNKTDQAYVRVVRTVSTD